MSDSNNRNTNSSTLVPSHSESPSSGVDVTVMLLTAGLASMIVFSALYGFREQIADYLSKQDALIMPRIVYVDSGKLFASQLDRIMKEHPDEPAKGVFKNRDFVNRLDKVLEKYTDAGYLVLTKQAVLRGFKGRDITRPVMRDLGLSPVDESVPNVSR